MSRSSGSSWVLFSDALPAMLIVDGTVGRVGGGGGEEIQKRGTTLSDSDCFYYLRTLMGLFTS